MRLHTLIISTAFATLVAACGPSFEAATPPQFVEIENDYDDFDHRAASADGVVFAVREIEHDPEGSRAFWSKAIENRMRDQGGYALLEKRDVKTAQGVDGTQLRFGHDEEGRPHLYYITLFVTEDTIYVHEAGGTKELMERHAAQVDWAVKHFWIK